MKLAPDRQQSSGYMTLESNGKKKKLVLFPIVMRFVLSSTSLYSSHSNVYLLTSKTIVEKFSETVVETSRKTLEKRFSEI